ncbi:hypothetical protein LZC95_09930 [Pendulispora brunnea]|uniref:Uncharacterized protein n=1 Tax=Pendulispora brunnea TaxID=2905690 RepID=A0ABZ2KEM7_9BACT
MGKTLDGFDRHASSPRAKTLRHRCPECGQTMRGTGKLYYLAQKDAWFVEYFCEREQEIIPLWSPDTQKLAEEIAADG